MNLRQANRHAAACILRHQASAGGFITLSSLYEACEANCDLSRNGIQWAICDAKEAGLICKTDERGLYAYAN